MAAAPPSLQQTFPHKSILTAKRLLLIIVNNNYVTTLYFEDTEDQDGHNNIMCLVLKKSVISVTID